MKKNMSEEGSRGRIKTKKENKEKQKYDKK
jgi:hypothetical protein